MATRDVRSKGIFKAGIQLVTGAAVDRMISGDASGNMSWVDRTRKMIVDYMAIKAGYALQGGGTITLDGSFNLKWSSRFIVISAGNASDFAASGYWDIDCPTSGTITGVGGASNATATAAGIPIGQWQALYYILPLGSNNASVAANFRLVSYTSAVDIPHNWVLIALRSGDTGEVVKLGDKRRVIAGTSINANNNARTDEIISTPSSEQSFSAYLGANSSGTGWTRIPMDTEEWDISGVHTTGASCKFQPTKAGYYLITVAAYRDTSSGDEVTCGIYKNGSLYKRGNLVSVASAQDLASTVTALVYLNGSTDYAEPYTYCNNNRTINASGTSLTYWHGHLAFVSSASSPATVIGCSLRATNGTNPVAGVYNWTGIGLSDERLDTNNSHTSGTSTWTVPRTGWYDLTALGCWDVNANGQRGVRIINTSDSNRVLVASEINATGGGAWTQHGNTAKKYLTAGHVLSFQAENINSGAIVSHVQTTAGGDGSGMDVFFVGD